MIKSQFSDGPVFFRIIKEAYWYHQLIFMNMTCWYETASYLVVQCEHLNSNPDNKVSDDEWWCCVSEHNTILSVCVSECSPGQVGEGGLSTTGNEYILSQIIDRQTTTTL